MVINKFEKVIATKIDFQLLCLSIAKKVYQSNKHIHLSTFWWHTPLTIYLIQTTSSNNIIIIIIFIMWTMRAGAIIKSKAIILFVLVYGFRCFVLWINLNPYYYILSTFSIYVHNVTTYIPICLLYVDINCYKKGIIRKSEIPKCFNFYLCELHIDVCYWT